jgi:protein TonB
MNGLSANRTSTGYHLTSELARLGLHATDRDPNRKVAWVNSICALFLAIGIVGSSPALIKIRALPPIEQISAVIVEPLPLPPQTAPEPQNQESSDEEKPEAPQVTVVTPESPSINFSVPTIGNLVVPNAIATAPPLNPMQPAAVLQAAPSTLQTTGSGGERPQPPYPKIALDQGQQGAVTLAMTVDGSGAITSVLVKESSGFPMLDRGALDFVRRHWRVQPGQGTRIYEATINYKITMN